MQAEALKAFEEGERYFISAGGLSGKSKFNPELVYNILSMACERFMTAAVEFHGHLPEDHNYTCLFSHLKKIVHVPEPLKLKLLELGKMQNMCNPHGEITLNATEEIAQEFRNASKELRDICKKCNKVSRSGKSDGF